MPTNTSFTNDTAQPIDAVITVQGNQVPVHLAPGETVGIRVAVNQQLSLATALTYIDGALQGRQNVDPSVIAMMKVLHSWYNLRLLGNDAPLTNVDFEQRMARG